MAINNDLSFRPYNPLKKRYGIASAMSGAKSAFSLPQNYGFNELADYEEGRRTQFAQDIRDQLAQRRLQLSSALTDQGKQLFEVARPNIVEDLNSRGVFNSSTAVAKAQADALKEIELSNQSYLNDFDTAATAAGLQGDQDALDAALDIRRSELENRLADANAAREEKLARDLAKESRRQGITNSLIGAGGSIFGNLLLAKAAGGAGAAGGAAGAGGVLGAGGAGGLGAALLPAALAVGGTLGYKALPDKAKAVVAPLVNPLKTAGTIGKSVSKAVKKLCFAGETLIEMADGRFMPISRLYLGAKTRGGEVESIRLSLTPEGTRYLYKGMTITGSHAVKENGRWLRVEDSIAATPLNGDGVVWSIVTDRHRIFAHGVEMADEHETDLYEELSLDESLAELNKQENLVGVA